MPAYNAFAPGCGCKCQQAQTCLVFSDNFDGQTNGSPPGAGWEVRRPTWEHWDNLMRGTAHDGLMVTTAEVDGDSGIVTATLRVPKGGPGNPGHMLIGAYRDDDNYLFGKLVYELANALNVHEGRVELWERRGGVNSLLAGSSQGGVMPIGVVDGTPFSFPTAKLCWDPLRAFFFVGAAACSSDICLEVGRRAGLGVQAAGGQLAFELPSYFDNFNFTRNKKDHSNCASCLSCRDHCIDQMPRHLFVRFPEGLFTGGTNCAATFNGVEHQLDPLIFPIDFFEGPTPDCAYAKEFTEFGTSRFYRIAAWYDTVFGRWVVRLHIATDTINFGPAQHLFFYASSTSPEMCGGMLHSAPFDRMETTGGGVPCAIAASPGAATLRGSQETGLDCYGYGGGGGGGGSDTTCCAGVDLPDTLFATCVFQGTTIYTDLELTRDPGAPQDHLYQAFVANHPQDPDETDLVQLICDRAPDIGTWLIGFKANGPDGLQTRVATLSVNCSPYHGVWDGGGAQSFAGTEVTQ